MADKITTCDFISENTLVFPRMGDGGRFMNSSRHVTDTMLERTVDNSSRYIYDNNDVRAISMRWGNPVDNRAAPRSLTSNGYSGGTGEYEKRVYLGNNNSELCSELKYPDDASFRLSFQPAPIDIVNQNINQDPILSNRWRGIAKKIAADAGAQMSAADLKQLRVEEIMEDRFWSPARIKTWNAKNKTTFLFLY